MITTLTFTIAVIGYLLSTIRTNDSFRPANLLKLHESLVFGRELLDEIQEGNRGIFD